MAAPEITEYSGDIPLRTGQNQTTFSNNIGTLLTYIPPFVAEMNASTAWVNGQAEYVELKAQDASDSADMAAESAATATNFKGRWTSLTGPLSVPASVYHNGSFWQLLDDLASVASSEPGVTTNWAISASSKLVDVKDVTSPHLLEQSDTGFILVFDDVGTAVLNIPDSLSRGTSVMSTNIGGGDVSLVNTGTDTTRGELLLGEITGYLAVTKVTSTIWQSSER